MNRQIHGKKEKEHDKSRRSDDGEARGQEGEHQQEQMVTIDKEHYESLKGKEKKLQDALDKMLRMQADFENVKKRFERDKFEFIRFSNSQIIGELIPFVDDFQRAFEAADTTKDFEVLHKGVEMILKHLLEFLKQKGVSEIEAIGKPFDPAYHEAVLQIESDEHPENTVIEELQKGYLLNNKVLRTAKVKVTKGKDAVSQEEGRENREEDKTE
jgi:molecular chaperone GrpE